jgi:hypothetical protein
MTHNSNANPDSQSRSDSHKRHYGNYLGIVVQNNDPEKTGKIKVWVPHVMPSVYENWTKVDPNKKIKDKEFKFPGANIDSDLSDIIDDLKTILPWAHYAGPIMGETSSGRYNAKLKVGTISDSYRPEQITPLKDTVYNATKTKYSLNEDGIGEKPARIYEVDDLKVHDAFSDVQGAGAGDEKTGMPNRVNKNTFNYKPSSYSNCAKGVFSIPNVGAHVWVFFLDGDPLNPVYFASSFGQEDWKSIYEASESDYYMDYPGTYENKGQKEGVDYDHNVETYRNKFVLNQKGGTLEIVNTDTRELLKLTHFSGSFKEFNNSTNIEFAAQNDQKLVMADQFLTVRGYRNEYTELDYDQIVKGDFYQKIGIFNVEYFKKWQAIGKTIHNIKQLFEIKRTKSEGIVNGFIRQSPGQKKSGTHGDCVLCTHKKREKYWKIDGKLKSYTDVNKKAKFNQKNTFAWLAAPAFNLMGDDINDSSTMSGKHFKSVSVDDPKPTQAQPGSKSDFLGDGKCPVCDGEGKHRSTQGGKWAKEDKDSPLKELLDREIENLLEIEKELGLGGNHIEHITKHKLETIGLVMNDLPSIRLDPVGKINHNEVLVRKQGVVTSFKESPLIEPVHVDELPGGTYTLNIANKYNVQVGSGGVSFKTTGPIELGGTIMNLGAEQINIASENEINIISGKRLNIVADILTLRQKNYNQVLIDCNLGVAGNVVIGGGMHVEGELTVQHITAPTELQETEQVKLQGAVCTGEPYIVDLTMIPCLPGCAAMKQPAAIAIFRTHPRVQNAPHSHQFRNIPLTMTQTRDDTRNAGKGNNKPGKQGAVEIKNEYKGGKSQVGKKIG